MTIATKFAVLTIEVFVELNNTNLSFLNKIVIEMFLKV